MLCIAERTIRNHLSLGIFPLKPVRIGGRVLFRVKDIVDYVANPEPEPVVEAPAVPAVRGRGRPRKVVHHE